MITLKPEDLSTQDNYKLLVGSVIPRPIALVTTQSEDGLVNLAPFSFLMLSVPIRLFYRYLSNA